MGRTPQIEEGTFVRGKAKCQIRDNVTKLLAGLRWDGTMDLVRIQTRIRVFWELAGRS